MPGRSSVYHCSLNHLCIDLSYLIEAIALDKRCKSSKGYPLGSIALLNLFKRSEEHTSELQSRLHLVCRLLLEKKKHSTASTTTPSPRQSRSARSAPAAASLTLEKLRSDRNSATSCMSRRATASAHETSAAYY